jgi:hypothetical protein
MLRLPVAGGCCIILIIAMGSGMVRRSRDSIDSVEVAIAAFRRRRPVVVRRPEQPLQVSG